MKKLTKNVLFIAAALFSTTALSAEEDEGMTPAQHSMSRSKTSEHEGSPAQDAMSDARQKPDSHDHQDNYFMDDDDNGMTPAQESAKRNQMQGSSEKKSGWFWHKKSSDQSNSQSSNQSSYEDDDHMTPAQSTSKNSKGSEHMDSPAKDSMDKSSMEDHSDSPAYSGQKNQNSEQKRGGIFGYEESAYENTSHVALCHTAVADQGYQIMQINECCGMNKSPAAESMQRDQCENYSNSPASEAIEERHQEEDCGCEENSSWFGNGSAKDSPAAEAMKRDSRG